MTSNFTFEPNYAEKEIYLACEFTAPIDKVWKAFTVPELIEKWLAPKPFTLETVKFDFTVGGIWLYAMIITDGKRGYTRIEFTEIVHESVIAGIYMFSDEHGSIVEGAPRSLTTTKFSKTENNGTKVEVTKAFTDEETVKRFAEMGFKEGTLMGYEQLDALLKEI
jgi:uncharacterized protein YndB with AHSA1/START domain